ncbi:MAG: phage tail protein [Candidatus Binataceae bacterium]
MLAPQWQLSTQPGESIDALTDIDSLTNVDLLTSSGGLAGSSDYDSWRALLRLAIPLHRTRGTPYAIKAALASLGWASVTLLEGQASWGGSTYPASQGWAIFRALINVAGGQEVAFNDALRAIAAIVFFKPARAWLDSLWFVAAPLADAAPVPQEMLVSVFSQIDTLAMPTDRVSAYAWPLVDTKLIIPLYDAHFRHGGITYGVNQPAVADAGVIVNGAVISANG